MKPDNRYCYLVNYFTVLYISSKYKKIFQVIKKLEVEMAAGAMEHLMQVYQLM